MHPSGNSPRMDRRTWLKGAAADYLIDVHDTSRRGGPAHRKKVIGSLACAFGTLGGPQVEPPQHGERDRWFPPTARRAADGGGACEFFFHILANPGDEITFHVAGKSLADPSAPWEKILASSVEEIHGTNKAATRDDLGKIFLDAEEAYLRHLSPGLCGTISMEPLTGNRPGPPVYLTQALNPSRRAAYAQDMKELRGRPAKLLPDVPDQDRMRKILRCLGNVLKNLGSNP